MDKSELRNVLEGERFIKNDHLHENDLAPGDVFKVSSSYYVNIRAACDLLPDRLVTKPNYYDVNLYLLKGSKLSEAKVKKVFIKQYGLLSEIDSQVIIFPMDGGKAIDFRFKELTIKKWAEIKDKRIVAFFPHL